MGNDEETPERGERGRNDPEILNLWIGTK